MFFDVATGLCRTLAFQHDEVTLALVNARMDYLEWCEDEPILVNFEVGRKERSEERGDQLVVLA